MFSNIQKLRSIDLTGLILPNETSSPSPPPVPLQQTQQPQQPLQEAQLQSPPLPQIPPTRKQITNSKTHHNSLEFIEDEYLLKNNNKPSLEDKDELQYPNLAIKRPYWKMRLICKSIRHGGFINSNIYVPQAVWYQDMIKFSGLAAKTSAYQAILSLLQNENVQVSDDILVLEKTNETISNLLEEFNIIQNQLWKPFPYIPEIKILNPDELNTSTTISTAATTVANAGSQSSSGSSSGYGFSSMMSLLKKGVKKYAGLGLSRFNALPTYLTQEEVTAYVRLMVTLCTAVQVFDKLYDQCLTQQEVLRKQYGIGNDVPSTLTLSSWTSPSTAATATTRTVTTNTDPSSSSNSSTNHPDTPMASIADNNTTIPTSNAPDATSAVTNQSLVVAASGGSADKINQTQQKEKYRQQYRQYELLQLIVDSLHKIGLFMRVAVCEIMMRDTEVFVTKYIQRLTKGFTHVSENDNDENQQQQLITSARIEENQQQHHHHHHHQHHNHSNHHQHHSHKITAALEAVLLGEDVKSSNNSTVTTTTTSTTNNSSSVNNNNNSNNNNSTTTNNNNNSNNNNINNNNSNNNINNNNSSSNNNNNNNNNSIIRPQAMTTTTTTASITATASAAMGDSTGTSGGSGMAGVSSTCSGGIASLMTMVDSDEED